jgi:hypothetical protein
LDCVSRVGASPPAFTTYASKIFRQSRNIYFYNFLMQTLHLKSKTRGRRLLDLNTASEIAKPAPFSYSNILGYLGQ